LDHFDHFGDLTGVASRGVSGAARCDGRRHGYAAPTRSARAPARMAARAPKA